MTGASTTPRAGTPSMAPSILPKAPPMSTVPLARVRATRFARTARELDLLFCSTRTGSVVAPPPAPRSLTRSAHSHRVHRVHRVHPLAPLPRSPLRATHRIDRMKKSGEVTSTINPPPGMKYTQCCAGEAASYFLRDDGAVDRSVSLPCVHQFLLNPTCSYTLHTYGCSRLYDDYITILQLPLLPLFSSLLSSFFSSSLRSSHRSRPLPCPPSCALPCPPSPPPGEKRSHLRDDQRGRLHVHRHLRGLLRHLRREPLEPPSPLPRAR